MSEPETVLCNEFVAVCETCGKPVVFRKLGAEGWTMQPHLTCDTPTISIMTHNPRTLGVITSDT